MIPWWGGLTAFVLAVLWQLRLGWRHASREMLVERLREADEAMRRHGWVIESITHNEGEIRTARWLSENGEWEAIVS